MLHRTVLHTSICAHHAGCNIERKKLDAAESIECFIKAILRSTNRPLPSPVSRQQIVFLSQSSCVSPVGLEKAWPSINHSILSGMQVPTAVLDYLFMQYCKLPCSLHFWEYVFSWERNHAGCGCRVRQGSVSSAFKKESIRYYFTSIVYGPWTAEHLSFKELHILTNCRTHNILLSTRHDVKPCLAGSR